MFKFRNRPYNGQDHTDQGVRGQMLVSGLTMRDISDCYKLALAQSSGEANPEAYQKSEEGNLDYSIYDLDLSNVDHGAIAQNLTCQIEKMMGIFPNLPERLKVSDDTRADWEKADKMLRDTNDQTA